MGRRAEGLHIRWRGGPAGKGVAYARFTWKGREYSESTGQRDPVAATAEAARIYARETGSAPRRTQPVAEPSKLELDPLTAAWIVDLRATHDARTAHEYDLVATKWADRWTTLGDITTATLGDYQRDCLGETTRATVKKKRTYMRTFLAWCVERGYLETAPTFPELGRHSTGKRKLRRPPRVARSPAQIARLLAALPVWSSKERRSEVQQYRVRDIATILYETALRPATVARLSCPEHWKPGAKMLHITADVDKNRRERDVPLTRKALGALSRCTKGEGLIFGAHELDDYLGPAAKKARLEGRFTTYDLKHSRITSWIRDGRDLAGISQLTGVDVDTLAEHYIHPDVEAAKRVLRRAG